MRKLRSIRQTLLIVGEGDAEVALLKHLRSLYTAGNAGRAVTVRNASGKGALHVVDYAARQRRNGEFTQTVALCDADTDWDHRAITLARKTQVDVVVSDPCLECWLLAVTGVQMNGTPAEIKHEFAKRMGGAAHQQSIYEMHFPRVVFDKARSQLEIVERLLAAIGV